MKRHREIISKFSGPPGTGKSTTLLNAVDQLLSQGISPEDIVYTTFTRAGAKEASDRACRKFNLTPERLPWFRTIHSICYGLIERKPAMAWGDWHAIGQRLGLHFSVTFRPEESVPRGQTRGDYLLSLWSYARVTQQHVDNVYNERHLLFLGHEDVSRQELHHFITSVTEYKKVNGKVDFTDMLEQYLADGPLLKPHAVIVDEAQDLSLLQWRVVDKMCQGARQVIIAGDDDQCIHAWNGASPEAFISLDARNYAVLPQSHRIPATVHSVAQKIITRVRSRLPKDYLPRTEPGEVTFIDDLSQLPLQRGTWFLLARNHSFTTEYAQLCREKGVLFTGERVDGLDPDVLRAVVAWKRLARGEAVSHDEACVLYRYLGQRDRVVRGFKTRLYEARIKEGLTYESLKNDWGLVAPKDLDWKKALTLLPEDTTRHLSNVEKHDGLEGTIRILIGTIHSVKGREADNVVLRPEMSYQTWEAFQMAPDAEHRCWYVGVTRARQRLFLLNSNYQRVYPL